MRRFTILLSALAGCLLAGAVLWTTAVNSEANRRASQAIADERIERARHWTDFSHALQQMFIDLGWALGCVLIAGLAVLVLLVAVGYWLKAHDRRYRAQDGLFALQSVRIGGGRILIDPNRMVGSALFASSAGVLELPSAAGWEAQVQVTAGAQRVAMASALGDVRYAAHGKFLAGAYDKPVPVERQLPVPVAESPPSAPVLLTGLNSVIEHSQHDKFILGQNRQSGKLAIFDPVSSVHGGIVGATGTGKTVSCGYVLAAQALRHNWHVVIVDPKGGADWQMFDGPAEWCESDSTTFGDQVRRLEEEHQRRQALTASRRVSSVRELPDAPTSMLVMIEEYGDLIDQLRGRNRKTADLVDNMLDTLMRRARSSDIHLVFIDQYPENWSHQVIGNTKFKAIFQLGPGQGAKLEEYKAGSLPDVGEFLIRGGERFQAWNGKTAVKRWLADQRLPSVRNRVIDAEYSVREGVREPVHEVFVDAFVECSPEVDPTPTNGTNTTNTLPVMDKDSWYVWAIEYMTKAPSLWESPPRGVREMARAMARHVQGDEGSFTGLASDLCKRIRSEARIGGERLGVDVTVQI